MSKLTKIFSGENDKKSVSKNSNLSTDRPPSRSRARRSISGKKIGPKQDSKKVPSDDKSGEHEAVRRARKALKPLIEETTKGESPISIGIVLAILNQETGNNKAANVLIDEYNLGEIFGLKKF